jgi:NADH dehydrogenase FAD-containing subunit
MAELEADDAARQPWLTFAIVGAGPTGVELAGQIAELSRRALRANFRRFDPACARIVLLDAADTVLPSYPPRLRRRARRDLEALGVELRLGTRVVGVDAAGLDIEGGRIEARTKIWAAGVQASSLGRLLADRAQATVDRAGRVQVAPDCSLPGQPEVFVVGDLMALDGLPGVAEVALQSGHHAARTILRRLRGEEPRPFHYRDLGTMATISRFRAVAGIGPIHHRPRRMVAVDPRPPRLHHRVQEPGSGGGRLGCGVPRARQAPADHHRAAGAHPGACPREGNHPAVTYRGRSGWTPPHPLRPGGVNRWTPRRRRAWPG